MRSIPARRRSTFCASAISTRPVGRNRHPPTRIEANSENAAITQLRKDVAAAGVPGLRIDRVQRDGGADETPKRSGKHWLLLGFMALIALSRFLGGP